jgi:hypothetical protein
VRRREFITARQSHGRFRCAPSGYPRSAASPSSDFGLVILIHAPTTYVIDMVTLARKSSAPPDFASKSRHRIHSICPP